MSKQVSNFCAKPNYDHWSQMARWEIEWLTALSLDVDPKIVSLESIQAKDCPQKLRDEYLDRLEIIENHKSAGRFLWPVQPGDFISWLISNGFRCPPALESALRKHGHKIADWRTNCEQLNVELVTKDERIIELEERCEALGIQLEDKKAQPSNGESKTTTITGLKRLIDTLEKMVLVMACDKYRYPLDGTQSSAAKNIEKALQTRNLEVSYQTILDRLKSAKEKFGDKIEIVSDEPHSS